MAEEEGFEPPRGLTRLSVFKTDPFSRTWVFLRMMSKIVSTKINIACEKSKVNIFKVRQGNEKVLFSQRSMEVTL